MKEYHYKDKISGIITTSNTELLTDGVELLAVIDLPDPLSPQDIKELALYELPKMIAKQQKQSLTDDPWQMWRYYNNTEVAQEILAGTADSEVVEAFEEMLAENKLNDSNYYGGMTTLTFAQWLISLQREFRLLGLRLETKRLQQRRELNSSQNVSE